MFFDISGETQNLLLFVMVCATGGLLAWMFSDDAAPARPYTAREFDNVAERILPHYVAARDTLTAASKPRALR